MSCFTCPTNSIALNGVLMAYCGETRVEAGGHDFSTLFLLCMHNFSHLFLAMVEGSSYYFLYKCDILGISHLMFVDDLPFLARD